MDFWRSSSSGRSRSPPPRPSRSVFHALEWANKLAHAVGIQKEALVQPLQHPLASYLQRHVFRSHWSVSSSLRKVLVTACSGTGAPSFALRKLIGPANFKELAAAELHVSLLGTCHVVAPYDPHRSVVSSVAFLL